MILKYHFKQLFSITWNHLYRDQQSMSSYTEYFTDTLDLVISCNFEKHSEKKLFHIYIRKILIQSINFYKLFGNRIWKTIAKQITFTYLLNYKPSIVLTCYHT